MRGFKVSPSKSRIVVFSLFGPRKTKKVKKSLKKHLSRNMKFFGNLLKLYNSDPILANWMGDAIPSPYQGETNPLIF